MQAIATFPGPWKPLSEPMYTDKNPPLVKNFHYRINGIVYIERSKAFIEAYEAEKFWYLLQKKVDL